MMAAAVAKRDLCYFTFDDADLRDDLNKMHEFLNEKKLSVSKYLLHSNRLLVINNKTRDIAWVKKYSLIHSFKEKGSIKTN